MMKNNRVDYLSDKLVHLRGKLKNVEDVLPKESIVNGVSAVGSATASAASGKSQQAFERRREQTCQLFSDYEQRLTRRRSQLQMQSDVLAKELERVRELQNILQKRASDLESLRIADDEELSASQLGERYRSIDRSRLEFFAEDGEIELLLMRSSGSGQNIGKSDVQSDSFSDMMKKGWALALSLGVVIALALVISALIIFAGWQ